jgi:hypothetical protein
VADDNLWLDDDLTIPTRPGYGIIRMNFTANVWPRPADTRTTGGDIDDILTDVHIILFDTAADTIVVTDYFDSSFTRCQIHAPIGTDYTLVAIANTADPDFLTDNSLSTLTKVKAFATPDITAWDDISNASALMMTGTKGNINIEQDKITKTELLLTRVAAKVKLHVTTKEVDDITITGYTLHNLPVRTRLIRNSLTSEADSVDNNTTRAPGDAVSGTRAGDWITSPSVDFTTTTTDFDYTFYMYENRPGVNDTISAQRYKTPAAIADSCTYLVVHGTSPTYSVMEWTVCLGANATTNFNIKRNCLYTYNILLSATSSDSRVKMEKGEISLSISPITTDTDKSLGSAYRFDKPTVAIPFTPVDKGGQKTDYEF